MKNDISSRGDIEKLVDEFYKKVKKDEVIGYFFTDVVNLSWEKHIPIMYDFWESVLISGSGYRGNPVLTHVELNRKSSLQKKHFEQWKKLFFETIDEYFEGEKANEAKKKADMMEKLMLYKIEQSTNKNHIQ